MASDLIDLAYVMKPPQNPKRTWFRELQVVEHVEIQGEGETRTSVSCPDTLPYAPLPSGYF